LFHVPFIAQDIPQGLEMRAPRIEGSSLSFVRLIVLFKKLIKKGVG
jgi:hypothetical protein